MKIEKRVKRAISVSVIILLVGMLLGAVIVIATTPSSTFYISSGVYPGAPSYTIWVEDSNYFAKDENGKLVSGSGGTNFVTLFDNVMTAVGTSGETVYLADGVYTATAQIVITDKNFGLIGGYSSWGQRYQGYNDGSENGATIIKGFNGDLMVINYTNHDYAGFSIQNIGFSGAYYNPPPGSGFTGKGLTVDNATRFVISDCMLANFEDDALRLVNGGACRVERVLIGEIYGYGVYLKDMGEDWWLIDVEINIGVAYTTSDRIALYIDTGCSAGHVTGGHFEGYYGLYLLSSSVRLRGAYFPWAYKDSVVIGNDTEIGGVLLTNCYIDGGNQAGAAGVSGHPAAIYWNCSYGKIVGSSIAGSKQAWGIYEATGSNYNDFSHNGIYMANSTGLLESYVRKISSYTDVTYNGWRYHTEHAGTEQIANGQTSVTFSHSIHYETATKTVGLTPNIVLVTFQDDLGAGCERFWVNVNSSKITVTVSAAVAGNKDFSWFAQFTTTTP